MRKITIEALRAIEDCEDWGKDNTQVTYNERTGVSKLFLHGHCIGTRNHNTGRTTINMCGYPTPTTRERLQALSVVVCQRKGEQFVKDTEDKLCHIDDNKNVYIESGGEIHHTL